MPGNTISWPKRIAKREYQVFRLSPTTSNSTGSRVVFWADNTTVAASEYPVPTSEVFEKLAKIYKPDESWYDEDFSELY